MRKILLGAAVLFVLWCVFTTVKGAAVTSTETAAASILSSIN